MLEILFALLLILVLTILVFLSRLSGKIGEISVNPETVKGAVATCWKELGIDKDLGAIKERAGDILQSSQSLENLFRVTRGRGEYGEFQLEQILKDILPPQYVHIRERIKQTGKIPDAHIVTPQGTVCIDSKFPLDNYRKMLEETDAAQKASFGVNFQKDVKSHIEKIKTDYVKSEGSTMPSALM